MKFSGKVGSGPSNKWSNFGGDTGHGSEYMCAFVRVCVCAHVCVCACRGASESSVPFVLFGTNTSRLKVEKSRRQLPQPSDVSLYDSGLPASHMVPSCLPVHYHSLTE